MLVKILIGVAGVLVLFGSPLEKLDPNMQKTFEGPAAGVGQSYAWSGNSSWSRWRPRQPVRSPSRARRPARS
jgi:hypothetical protein